MLSLINVPGGFYRLYRIVAKDFDNLNRSFLATNTVKFLFSNTFVLLYLFNSSIFTLRSNTVYNNLIIQCYMISAHWAVPVHSPQFCTQFTFHTDRFQLKREISRTMTFCLYYANTFVERYEKTIKILLSLLLVFDGRCKSNHQWNSICLYGQRIFKW